MTKGKAYYCLKCDKEFIGKVSSYYGCAEHCPKCSGADCVVRADFAPTVKKIAKAKTSK